jgi:hypothetical protein
VARPIIAPFARLLGALTPAGCSAPSMLARCCGLVPPGVQVIGFHSFHGNRMLAGAFTVALALAQRGLGRADEEAGRLKLRALTRKAT